MTAPEVLPNRIAEKIDSTPDGCWQWMAARNAQGYGAIWHVNQMRLAHRVVYELLVGPIPAGLMIDHLCRVRHCVNPAHLEPVDHATNMARSGPATKTHCANGHAYDDRNTYRHPVTGFRSCRRCNVANVTRWRREKRGRAA